MATTLGCLLVQAALVLTEYNVVAVVFKSTSTTAKLETLLSSWDVDTSPLARSLATARGIRKATSADTESSKLRDTQKANGSRSGSEDAVQQLSNQLSNLQKQADEEQIECSASKGDIEVNALILQHRSSTSNSDMASVETMISTYSGELAPLATTVRNLRERSKYLNSTCQAERGELETRRLTALEDLRIVQKQRAWKTGFLSVGRRELQKLPRSASRPEPDPDVSESTMAYVSKVSSSREEVEDALAQAEESAASRVAQAVHALDLHEAQCEHNAEIFNAQIKQKVQQITAAQTEVAQMTSRRSGLRAEVDAREEALRSLLRRGTEQKSQCDDSVARLEMEATGLIETRQALVWKFLDTSGKTIVQDCEVGAWIKNPCTKSCGSGELLMTRPVIVRPDNATESGRLGAACPATQHVLTCNNVPCPVDCLINEWSEWASCSKECGGGDRYRTRAVQRSGLHGGLTCGATSESQICNMEPCRKDCVLSDWTDWGGCSRRCTWSPLSEPARAYRTRHVVTPAGFSGTCPDGGFPQEARACNAHPCPADINALNCSANQDIITIVDGSGSMASGDEALAEDDHFVVQKRVVEGLIHHANFSNDAGGNNTHGIRLGIVVVGGAEERPNVVSPLSGTRASLVTALNAAQWPKGYSYIGRGLQTATSLFRVSEWGSTQSSRQRTVLLMTDGKLQNTEGAVTAAKSLKEIGVRLIVILVQDSGDKAVPSINDNFCRIASAPCADNVLWVDWWKHMGPQLGRFLNVICPV